MYRSQFQLTGVFNRSKTAESIFDIPYDILTLLYAHWPCLFLYIQYYTKNSFLEINPYLKSTWRGQDRPWTRLLPQREAFSLVSLLWNIIIVPECRTVRYRTQNTKQRNSCTYNYLWTSNWYGPVYNAFDRGKSNTNTWECGRGLGPKWHSPNGSMPFHRTQKVLIFRAQPSHLPS